MVEFKTGKCPKCGKIAEIIYTNNPLVPGICEHCIKTSLDASDLKQADFFCRTYNLPFDPSVWIELYDKVGSSVFKVYTKRFYETNTDKNLYYSAQTKDWWSELNEEWSSCITFEQLLNKIEPVKQKFIERNKIKWGGDYSFEQYVQLENLLISTLRANNITNPLQIDAIKKTCKIAVELEKAIADGDSKAIKDMTSAYSTFVKTAQLDEVIEASNSDVVSTVAELVDYIEKCGGKFTYYDNVDRDIVDKTIKDIQTYNRNLVQDATGLTTLLESLTQNYKQSLEQKADDNAAKAFSIEDIVREQEGDIDDFDKECESQSIDDIMLEDTSDDNF